jgi:hypothetical protein
VSIATERADESGRAENEGSDQELLPDGDRATTDDRPHALDVVPLLRRDRFRASLRSIAETTCIALEQIRRKEPRTEESDRCEPHTQKEDHGEGVRSSPHRSGGDEGTPLIHGRQARSGRTSSGSAAISFRQEHRQRVKESPRGGGPGPTCGRSGGRWTIAEDRTRLRTVSGRSSGSRRGRTARRMLVNSSSVAKIRTSNYWVGNAPRQTGRSVLAAGLTEGDPRGAPPPTSRSVVAGSRPSWLPRSTGRATPCCCSTTPRRSLSPSCPS